LAALAALAEPLRRRLYLHVAERSEPVSRDEAARDLGVPRSVAAFHLDKLAEVGLLEVEYRRPPGRTGPGAGRPAKRYRRAAGDVGFHVPERRYDVVATLLVEAIEEAREQSISTDRAVRAVARRHGRALAAEASRDAGPEGLDRVAAVLEDCGYEPRRTEDAVTLENCPYFALTQDHRDLVCAMNLEMIHGVLEGLGIADADAQLDPAPGRCCVTVRPS